VIFDAVGNAIAENTIGIPSFNMTMSRTLRHFLQWRPAPAWRPGDVGITNDPWLATGHLPDITMLAPVFHRGELFAWVGSTAHQADIGGAPWAADANEVFEEGLRIPPMLLAREGDLTRDLLELIRANVRLPDEVVGDVMAQLSAGSVASQRLVGLAEDARIESLRGISRDMRRLADQAMRAAVRDVPDGTYRANLDLDGAPDAPIHLEVAVTVTGDSVHVDYGGSSAQVRLGFNCVFNYTEAYTCYPLKCALDPTTPRNESSYDCITVTAPLGSIVNPRFPAAVNARALVGHTLAGLVFQALAEAVPDKVLAESGSAPTLRAVISGVRPDGDRFTKILFVNGGMGAGVDLPGLPATCFPSNVVCGSMEALEASAPLRVWRKELASHSGGIGQWTGGAGQDVELELLGSSECLLSLFAERIDHPARGVLGGHPGRTAEVTLSSAEGELRELDLKGRNRMFPGDRLAIRYPGGGGYCSPTQPATRGGGRD
jgi:N-methylhydantoinase B